MPEEPAPRPHPRPPGCDHHPRNWAIIAGGALFVLVGGLFSYSSLTGADRQDASVAPPTVPFQSASSRPKAAEAGRAKDPLLELVEESLRDAKAKETAGNLDEALAVCDAAVQAFARETDGRSCARKSVDILTPYKEIIAISDRLVDRVETPELEARIAIRDMLSPSERREWGTSEGAEYEFPPGRLRMNGVAPEGKKIMGVVSFAGWTPPWHDVVLDLEFTIVSGRFELYLRYRPTRRWYQLDFGPDAGYELNKPHQVTLRVKGSTVEMIAPDQPLQSGQLDLRTSRTGGVGFGLPPGGEIVLSSCKIKVLRPRS